MKKRLAILLSVLVLVFSFVLMGCEAQEPDEEFQPDEEKESSQVETGALVALQETDSLFIVK